MGVLSKLAFWKKKDDFDLEKDFGADLGLEAEGSQFTNPNLGLPKQSGGRDLGLPEGSFDSDWQESAQSSTQPPGRPVQMRQPFGASIPVQQPIERDFGSNEKFEVVSAKLDSIRYTLESINQRLINLERVAYGEYEKKKGW